MANTISLRYFGYKTMLPAEERNAALQKAVDEVGIDAVISRLEEVMNLQSNENISNIMSDDLDWLCLHKNVATINLFKTNYDPNDDMETRRKYLKDVIEKLGKEKVRNLLCEMDFDDENVVADFLWLENNLEDSDAETDDDDDETDSEDENEITKERIVKNLDNFQDLQMALIQLLASGIDIGICKDEITHGLTMAHEIQRLQLFLYYLLFS